MSFYLQSKRKKQSKRKMKVKQYIKLNAHLLNILNFISRVDLPACEVQEELWQPGICREKLFLASN